MDTFADPLIECNHCKSRFRFDKLDTVLKYESFLHMIKEKISHFVSRKAMNIAGLGDETISLLFDNSRMVGGVVLEDDRHFTFVYENGQLTYEEE